MLQARYHVILKLQVNPQQSKHVHSSNYCKTASILIKQAKHSASIQSPTTSEEDGLEEEDAPQPMSSAIKRLV